MQHTAKLETSVNLAWEDRKGCDRDCTVEVTYTYDGSDLRIIAARNDSDLGDWEFDELLYEAVSEVADEQYAEWLADFDGFEVGLAA